MKASTSRSSSTTTNPYAIQAFQNAQAALPTAFSPVTGSQIDGFMNPYQSSVIDATTARNTQNQQMALNQIGDQAQRAGAFGGSRQGVAEALTRGQFDLNNQQTAAQLNSQNYGQALQVAMMQNQDINQYPLAVQGLLGNLARGTQSKSTGSATAIGLQIGDDNTSQSLGTDVLKAMEMGV